MVLSEAIHLLELAVDYHARLGANARSLPRRGNRLTFEITELIWTLLNSLVWKLQLIVGQ